MRHRNRAGSRQGRGGEWDIAPSLANVVRFIIRLAIIPDHPNDVEKASRKSEFVDHRH